VAEQLQQVAPRGVEVVCTSATGFRLLDYILNASRLIVIDTIVSGTAEPGTVCVLREEEIPAAPGGSPHYVGLFDALALGRKLELPVPQEVIILAVEAADCSTVGSAIHPAVREAMPVVVNLAQQFLRASRFCSSTRDQGQSEKE